MIKSHAGIGNLPQLNFLLWSCRSAQRWCVKQHIVEVHKKLRLYLCPHCQHRAGTRGNLNVHIRAVHFKDRKTAKNTGELLRLATSKTRTLILNYGTAQSEVLASYDRLLYNTFSFLANKKTSSTRQPGTFACNFCGYVTSVEFDLYRHINDEHAVEAASTDAAPAPVRKTVATAKEEEDDALPLDVVTLDEAGLRSGKISIVYE